MSDLGKFENEIVEKALSGTRPAAYSNKEPALHCEFLCGNPSCGMRSDRSAHAKSEMCALCRKRNDDAGHWEETPELSEKELTERVDRIGRACAAISDAAELIQESNAETLIGLEDAVVLLRELSGVKRGSDG